MAYHIWRDGIPPDEDKVVMLTSSGKWVATSSPLFTKLVARFHNMETAQDAATRLGGAVVEERSPVEGRRPDAHVGVKPELVAAFAEFDRQHPSVYVHFAGHAKEVIDSGKKKVSYRAVLERARWTFDHIRPKLPVKINMRFAAMYGRKFVREYPQYAKYFRLPKGVRSL